MGCVGSTIATKDVGGSSDGNHGTKKVRKPKAWKHPQPITMAQLRQMREEFWDTSPHYGGQKEIWDALRVASESEVSHAQAVVESAGIIVSNADLTLCYDERGMAFLLDSFLLDSHADRKNPRTPALPIYSGTATP